MLHLRRHDNQQGLKRCDKACGLAKHSFTGLYRQLKTNLQSIRNRTQCFQCKSLNTNTDKTYSLNELLQHQQLAHKSRKLTKKRSKQRALAAGSTTSKVAEQKNAPLNICSMVRTSDVIRISSAKRSGCTMTRNTTNQMRMRSIIDSKLHTKPSKVDNKLNSGQEIQDINKPMEDNSVYYTDDSDVSDHDDLLVIDESACLEDTPSNLVSTDHVVDMSSQFGKISAVNNQDKVK